MPTESPMRDINCLFTPKNAAEQVGLSPAYFRRYYIRQKKFIIPVVIDGVPFIHENDIAKMRDYLAIRKLGRNTEDGTQ